MLTVRRLTPTAVSVVLPPAGSTSTTLDLANLGTGMLRYTISEVPGDITWLAVDPTAGMIYPSTGQAVDLFIDAAGLAPDACYSGTLQFLYDDPYVMEEFVPVELCVTCDGVTDVDFNWTPPTPTAGLPVTFTATASGTAPITLYWDLGDGTVLVTSDTMATHTYTEAGDYQVALTATNCATATAAVVHDVVVAAACEAVYGTAFSWMPLTPTVGQGVSFSAQASGTTPIAFTWDFGDGSGLVTTATVAAHTYTATGGYTVTLSAANGCGEEVVIDLLNVASAEWRIYLPILFKNH